MARIAAIRNPVIRNLEITHAYSLLAAELAARSGQGANWCTFATWASRQAGRTIRGEDAMGYIEQRLCLGRSLLHPFRSAGRWLLRKGLFDRGSRIGRVMARLRTPFDAVELASDAVARGNLKVFAEIGYEFARYVSDEDGFAVDAPLLQVAFACYDEAFACDDARRRAELILRANLCIGLHEQTRLQPEIGEALDAPYVTAEALGRMLCGTTRRRLAVVVGTLAKPAQALVARFSREVITHSLMVLSQYEPVPPALDDCGAEDWSSLDQRMHYIVHLFRVFHLQADMARPPFTEQQVELFLAGVVPDGTL